ncbi:MAG: hypothetical protein IPM51_02600 [Sphingobacteriaceae bacterium]|nr:hypothetical protein [Sphingobacteriaceae bacterium]
MKKLISFILILVSVAVKGQTDSSALDKLTPEELLQYYINEPEPPSTFKGPEKVGDSLFENLNTQVVPTETVHANALFREGQEQNERNAFLLDSVNRADFKMKPKIGLGFGRLAFYGDLYDKRFQSPLTARMAYDLNVSQRLTRYLQLNFNVMFGKLGANEYKNNRQENFQSEIRSGGVNLLYDFGNFMPDRYKLRPFISLGVIGFEFLSKTDLMDKDGNTYHYWSDGSIKNMAENAPGAQFAKDIYRDYTYETDVRERNIDGFGQYRESAFAFPISAGFIAKVTDRVDMKVNFSLYISTTDYIDGVTNNSVGERSGNKQKDNFTYTSFGLQYDLIAKTKEKKKLAKDTLNSAFWLAMDNEDRDKDGVTDLKDDCQGTPEGVKVDDKGCPLDDDKDGIPNFRDDELATALGVPVNEKGVGQTDDYWQAWYNDYMNDSLGADVEVEYVGNVLALDQKKNLLDLKKDLYTVELARYEGTIPSDEMAMLLSIGDIKSITLDNGTTVVYTAGEYKKIKTAIKRRDEFKNEGLKDAGISKIKGKKITRLTEEEIEAILNKQNANELKANGENTLAINSGTGSVENGTVVANTNTATAGTNTLTEVDPNDEVYNRSDIIYRVQLGAFRQRISTSVFNTNAGVLELKTSDNTYRYVTKGYKTIQEAAAVRADLVIQGYSDAFVTAYQDGKRIPMNKTKATVEKSYKEDMNEEKMFSSVDKKLVVFRIQLGTPKKAFAEKSMDERVKDITGIQKQTTNTGTIRYVVGEYNGMDSAEKSRKDLESKGFADAFIIATFKGNIISIQEAMELLK